MCILILTKIHAQSMAHLRRVVGAGLVLKIACRYSGSTQHPASNVVQGTETTVQKWNYSVNEKLINVGLSNDSALAIASKPEFSYLNGNLLDSPLEILERCQFGGNSLTKLIESHPMILLVDSRTLEKTCINLLSVFTKKYAYEILLKSPEVLNESWESVSNKLKYLNEEMGVSNMDIVQHGILSHPLDYIKVRHEFLNRTGKYKKLSSKIKPRERHLINPGIDKVLNSTSKYFSINVAGVSELEFQVFQQLYFDSEDSS